MIKECLREKVFRLEQRLGSWLDGVGAGGCTLNVFPVLAWSRWREPIDVCWRMRLATSSNSLASTSPSPFKSNILKAISKCRREAVTTRADMETLIALLAHPSSSSGELATFSFKKTFNQAKATSGSFHSKIHFKASKSSSADDWRAALFLVLRQAKWKRNLDEESRLMMVIGQQWLARRVIRRWIIERAIFSAPPRPQKPARRLFPNAQNGQSRSEVSGQAESLLTLHKVLSLERHNLKLSKWARKVSFRGRGRDGNLFLVNFNFPRRGGSEIGKWLRPHTKESSPGVSSSSIYSQRVRSAPTRMRFIFASRPSRSEAGENYF